MIKKNPMSRNLNDRPDTTLDIELNPSAQDAAVDQTFLIRTVRGKNIDSLYAVGHVPGIARALNTDVRNGILDGELEVKQRKERFGSNTYIKPKEKGFFSLVWDALKDPTLIILLVCAAIELGFGMKEHGPSKGWYEGGSICIAVFLVVVVSSISNYKQGKQFTKLSEVSSNISVNVVRGGRPKVVSIFDIVVGDVVVLMTGDQIPADGVFIEGTCLLIDESSMTGESEPVEVNSRSNPFLHSGSKVLDGHGRMLVTSVGMNTCWGEMMSSINNSVTNEETPLQVRLNGLTGVLGKVGLSVAFLVLVVLVIRYFTGNTRDVNGKKEYQGGETHVDMMINSLIRIVFAAVTIVVIAIPEGLPLAVTLTLAYSMKRMVNDNAMVRKLSACETMGSATVICTDKTGTLTLNQMQVTKAWIGNEEISQVSSLNIIDLLQQGVVFNSTCSIFVSSSEAEPEIVGSPTEKAVILWCFKELGLRDVDELKQNYSVLQVESFNSNRKTSGVMIKNNRDGAVHVHWKGAAEIVLAMCSYYYAPDGTETAMNEDERNKIRCKIEEMASNSLRCIAFAHTKQENEDLKIKENGMTLLAIVGLKDPCRPEVNNAVNVCKNAGVEVKMITGDNILTAKSIAIECGILDLKQERDEVVEGSEFRNYTDEERMEKIDRIKVMARSSPLDKLMMVQCLRKKGHVVAVTGDGTNDAPALKEADIGLSMGHKGTEVAKESSDIVILDDNFNTVVTVLSWGRCVYSNIQKFMQFQLTINVSAIVINFISAAFTGEVPLTTVQLLWVNLIQDSLAALALATEPPTKELLNKPPVGRTEPIITNIMWRNILSQSLFQLIVLLVLQFEGRSVFDVSAEVKNTLIFNTFVFCQVFNEFNSRKLEKKNVFEGIQHTPLFIGIVGITIVAQIAIVELLNDFANTVKLSWYQWGYCIGIASLSCLVDFLVKLIPDPRVSFYHFSSKK